MSSFEWEDKDGVFGNYVEKDEHDEFGPITEEELCLDVRQKS